MSKEEIARVKAKWEAKEARKKDKDKGKDGKAKGADKSGGKKDAEGEGEKEEDGKKGVKSPSPPGPGNPSSPPAAGSGIATPTHRRYSLHRDIFSMRQAEHRRKRQTKQMQELAPRLPGAPYGSPLR